MAGSGRTAERMGQTVNIWRSTSGGQHLAANIWRSTPGGHGQVKHLHHVTQWLSNAQSACAKVRARNNGHSHEKLLELIEENVIQQLKHLETHPSVAARMAVGDVLLHGWVYDIGTGAVFCHESDNGTFVPVSEHYANILSRNGGLLDHHAA